MLKLNKKSIYKFIPPFLIGILLPIILSVINISSIVSESDEILIKNLSIKKYHSFKNDKNKLFLLSFKGDPQASQTKQLRKEIDFIILNHKKGDEVILQLESLGGGVAEYGLAYSQLMRLDKYNIPLTISIDHYAASGGYLMALAADNIYAAPFAFIGSIGVKTGNFNYSKLLSNLGVGYNTFVSNKHKEPVNPFVKMTDESIKIIQNDIHRIFQLFKNTVKAHRKFIDLKTVSTGEVWNGYKAKELKLIDDVKIFEDILSIKTQKLDLISVKIKIDKEFSFFQHILKSITNLNMDTQNNYLM